MSKKNVIKKSPLAPTVLISGGAGFIGYYLVEAFLEKGARVVVLDSISDLETNRVARFVKNPKFALFNSSNLTILPEEIESVDYVIHIGDLEKYMADRDAVSLDTLLVNSQSIKSLLDLSYKSNAKFLLLSTIDVYENTNSPKVNVDYFGHTVVAEDSFKNADARKFAEAVVWEHSRKMGTNVRVVRIPYVYGPKMNLDSCGALGIMLRDVIHRCDLTIYGDETRKEYYLYIEDAISGIVKALFSPNTDGNTYSLIGEDSHKVLTTAFLLRTLADRRTELEFKKSVKRFPKDIKIPSLFNLKELDWWPKYELKEGVIKTLDHFGYRVNFNTFKPKDLILQKQKLKSRSVGAVDSLFDSNGTDPTFKEDTGYKVTVDYDDVDYSSINIPKSRISLLELIIDKSSEYLSKINFSKVNAFFNFSPAIVLASLAVFISALIIFVVAPLITFSSGIRSGYSSLEALQKSLSVFDIEGAKMHSENADLNLSKARASYVNSKWLYTLFLKPEGYTAINNTLISLNHFSKATHSLTLALDPYKNLWDIMHPDSQLSLDPASLVQSQSQIMTANTQMQLAKANFSYVLKSKLPTKIQPLADTYENYLYSLSKDLETVSVVSSDFQELLGISSPKTYIVWFQNSNEIRPTGGFIGSYGVLTVDKGKITSLSIDDIYNPDGQIELRNIRYPLPGPLANALAEDRMYLRNSNWHPDLAMSAKDFSDLYTRVTDVPVDGVIAIDLYFVKNLLSSLGPIYLASYNEEITADNLYERAQFYSDFNYQEGDSDKKTFLTVLGSKLLEELFAADSTELPKLLSSIYTSLDEKHLLLSFNNNATNLFINSKGWGGNLLETNGDYLYIVNANVGGTKSNYYVSNNYKYVVSSETRDGVLRGTLELAYVHNGRDMSWPGGPYKNYIRVLTKEGSFLTGAKLFYNTNPVEDIFTEVTSTRVGAYNSFELPITLNPQDTIKIVLEYDLPTDLSLTKSMKEYSLVWQKQPGTQEDQVSFEFLPPFGTEFQSVNSNLKANSDSKTLLFSDILNTDKKVFVTLK